MTPDIVVFVFLIQFLGYGVKGLIGFGNPLIASPLLSMRLDNVVITPGTLLPDVPVNFYLAWSNRKNIRWAKILPFIAANICGAVPGTLLLRFSMPWVIKTLLGIVVVYLGLDMALRSHRSSSVSSRGNSAGPVSLLIAFLSGVCSGLFGINMILAGYIRRITGDYQEYKGSICLLFFCDNVFRLCIYLLNGLLTTEVMMFGAISLAAAGIAMLLARHLTPLLDDAKLQKAAIVLFLCSGLSIMTKSLIFHT